MKGLLGAVVAMTFGLVSTLHAATFTVVFDQDTVTGNASGTLLTLNFGNSTNSATTFTDADFVSRTWTNLDQFGPSNLTSNVGLYPLSNLANTTPSIVGSVSATTAPLNFGFIYTETDAALGFVPFDFDRVIANRMRGLALWTAIDGFFPNFYLDSIGYSATGTAADFAAPKVPVPAGLPLLLTGLAALGATRLFGRK
jgi:hypothetical protein